MQIPTVDLDGVPDPLPKSLHILDVREPIEWQHGHIEGAQHIPLQQVPDKLAEIPADGPILVVCKVGGRSAKAAGFLISHGLDAINLQGGMLVWEAGGRAMVSETGEPPQIV